MNDDDEDEEDVDELLSHGQTCNILIGQCELKCNSIPARCWQLRVAVAAIQTNRFFREIVREKVCTGLKFHMWTQF